MLLCPLNSLQIGSWILKCDEVQVRSFQQDCVAGVMFFHQEADDPKMSGLCSFLICAAIYAHHSDATNR